MREPLKPKDQMREYQSYMDEPVCVFPRVPSKISEEVELALSGTVSRMPPPVVVGYTRVRLRWMKPDGHGGLVPR